MKQGFDAAPYFYRNCAALDCFSDFYVQLPNVEQYAKDMIILPTYPDVPLDYIEEIADAVNSAASDVARTA